MPLKNTPCPRCGKLKGAKAATCIDCRMADRAQALRLSTTCRECGGPKARKNTTDRCWECYNAARPKPERVCACGQTKHHRAIVCSDCRKAMRKAARKTTATCSCGNPMYRASTKCMSCSRQSNAKPAPTTKPAPRHLTSTRRIHPEDIEWLIECHPLITSHELADRLGVTRSGIQHALDRAGRQDLLDQLTRNAEYAGHAVTRRTA